MGPLPEAKTPGITIDLTGSESGAPRPPQQRRRPGRVPLHQRFPKMVESARAFIESNGTKAQERRRSSTVTMSNGVTLRQLRDHVLAEVPELTSLSLSTVARMLVAPNKGNRNARRYHGAVNAKVAAKSNTRRLSKHPGRNHICMSQMGFMLEQSVDMYDCVDVWSVDDKAKLKVSSDCPCVSRYHQLRRIFGIGDAPNYKDHDFPTAGYLLCPSGYKRLVQEPWQRTTQYFDRHGRPHLPVCREGPLKIVLRACKYQQSNAMSHANDMYRMYKETEASVRKPVLMCYADGGPDWAVDGRKSLYYYGKFWMRTKLDAFGVGSGGGGYSAFNPIERSWSPVSKVLSGTYLSDKLPGESKAPINQSGLTAGERADKEHVVFDNAMRHAAKLWNNDFTIAGHRVQADVVPCAATPTPFNDMGDFELWCRIAATHVGRRDMIAARLTKLEVPATKQRVQAMVNITNRMRFFTRHCDRRSEFLLFTKCDGSCSSGWCKDNPRREQSRPFFDLICRHGNYFTPQHDRDGSYKTYLQVRDSKESCKFVPNELMDAEYGPRDYPYRCDKGCKWIFTSKADYKRHKGRGFCVGARAREARGRKRKRRKSRAKGAADDARAQPRPTGKRFACCHQACVAAKKNQAMTRQKRARHWREQPDHKPPPKKAKLRRPRHLPPSRSLSAPAASGAAAAAASTAVSSATTTSASSSTATTTSASSATATTTSASSDESDDEFAFCSDEESSGGKSDNVGDDTEGPVEVDAFNDKEHDKVIEVLVNDDDAGWRHSTIFQHKESKGYVLWFNGTEEYEGLGGTYTYASGVLRDPDGDQLECRRLEWWRRDDCGDSDYCGTCYRKRRFGSAAGAARALRAASRSNGVAAAPARPDVWYAVTEYNCRERCIQEHYNNGVYEAECDDCGADLSVTPATAE